VGNSRFRLISFDEGGVSGSPAHRRLVCLAEGGGKIAIWGREIPLNNMRNIQVVLAAGLPCTIQCDHQPPGQEEAEKFGHTHWVREDFSLRVVTH
jgi:hypothetical protein